MNDWTSKFKGIEWRKTPEGVETREDGVFRTRGEPVTARRVRDFWGQAIQRTSIVTGVPPEILMMTLLTEGALKWNGEGFDYPPYREEPGWRDDWTTGHRVSVGPTHILLSNFRSLMYAPKATREEAANFDDNLLAAAFFIRERDALHRYDPILVAAIYNSGGLYEASDPESKYYSPFHLKAWPGHLERAARWYGDSRAVLKEQPLPRRVPQLANVPRAVMP